jgi:7-cyano-7-deazaguanine synthase in queuosine biosynthesis
MVQKLVPDTLIEDRLNLADWEARDANIPLRNAFLVMIASYYDTSIALVVQKGELDIPDRSVKFFNEFGGMLTFLWGRRTTLTTPFFAMTKTQMVRWYLDEGLNPATLLSTRSCYSPDDLPCGACAACFRRWIAFVNNGLTENYTNDITEYSEIPKYIEKMRLGKYDSLRTHETFNALKKVGVL